MQVIYVEDTFNSDEAEGVRLTEELTIGKQMAGGTQVSRAPLPVSLCCCSWPDESVWRYCVKQMAMCSDIKDMCSTMCVLLCYLSFNAVVCSINMQ